MVGVMLIIYFIHVLRLYHYCLHESVHYSCTHGLLGCSEREVAASACLHELALDAQDPIDNVLRALSQRVPCILEAHVTRVAFAVHRSALQRAQNDRPPVAVAAADVDPNFLSAGQAMESQVHSGTHTSLQASERTVFQWLGSQTLPFLESARRAEAALEVPPTLHCCATYSACHHIPWVY